MLRQSQSFQSYNPIGQVSPKHHHHHHHFDAYHHHHHHSHQTSTASSSPSTASLNYNFPSSQHSSSASTKTSSGNFSSSVQELNSSPGTHASWMSRNHDKPKQQHSYGDQDQTAAQHYANETKPSTVEHEDAANEQSMKMVFKQENVSKSDYYDAKSTFELDAERSRDNLIMPKDDSKYLPYSSSTIKSKSSLEPKTEAKTHRISTDFTVDNMKKEQHDLNFSHYQPPPPLAPAPLDINPKPLRYPQDMYQSDYFNSFPYTDTQQQQQQTTASFLPTATAAPFQPYNMYSHKSQQHHNLTNFEQKIPLHKYPTGKVERIDEVELCKLPTSK